MAVKTVTVTVNGRTYVVERDADSNVLIRRYPLPEEQRPLKERLEDEMRAAAQDLIVWNHFIEQAIARGESAGAITEVRALETQLYNRVKDIYLEWRVQ